MVYEISVFLGTLFSILLCLFVSFVVEKRISKKFNAKRKRWWLISHIAFVLIYFSGILGTLLLALTTLYTSVGEEIYAAHLFIQYFDWFLIIPGAFGSLITGFGLAVGTWGLTKHYWVIAKWVGNAAVILFGAVFMRIWIHDAFGEIFSSQLSPLNNLFYLENRQMLFIGIAISLSMLSFLVIISYVKPWGKRKKYKSKAT